MKRIALLLALLLPSLAVADPSGVPLLGPALRLKPLAGPGALPAKCLELGNVCLWYDGNAYQWKLRNANGTDTTIGVASLLSAINPWGSVSLGLVDGSSSNLNWLAVTPSATGTPFKAFGYSNANQGGVCAQTDDTVMRWGWNCGAGGKENTGPSAICMEWEHDYCPGAPSLEQDEPHVLVWYPPGSSTGKRVFTGEGHYQSGLFTTYVGGDDGVIGGFVGGLPALSWSVAGGGMSIQGGSGSGQAFKVEAGLNQALIYNVASNIRVAVADGVYLGGNLNADQVCSGHGCKVGSATSPFGPAFFGGTIGNRPTCDGSMEGAHYTVPATGGTPTHAYQCCDTTGAGGWTWVAGTCP